MDWTGPWLITGIRAADFTLISAIILAGDTGALLSSLRQPAGLELSDSKMVLKD
jgi:hypothetical protein